MPPNNEAGAPKQTEVQVKTGPNQAISMAEYNKSPGGIVARLKKGLTGILKRPKTQPPSQAVRMTPEESYANSQRLAAPNPLDKKPAYTGPQQAVPQGVYDRNITRREFLGKAVKVAAVGAGITATAGAGVLTTGGLNGPSDEDAKKMLEEDLIYQKSQESRKGKFVYAPGDTSNDVGNSSK